MYGIVKDRSTLERLLLSDVSWLNTTEREEILDTYFGSVYYPSWPVITGPQYEEELDQGEYADYEISYNCGHIMVRNLTDVTTQGPFYGLTTDEVWNPEV